MSENDDNNIPLQWPASPDEELQFLNAIYEDLYGVELPTQPSPPPPLPPPPPPQFQPLPYVEIVEDTACRTRFRYGTEMQNRSRGSIRGVHSTPARETYPTIRVNHNGLNTAIVVVSCVTKNIPYKVHPHKLFGPGTRDGLFVSTLPATNELQLNGIGIHRATRSEVSRALEARAAVRVPEVHPNLQIDPFGHGFNHAADIRQEDLHAVRLAFQVFVQITEGVWTALVPVVSQPIFNENVPSDVLEIRWVSDVSGTFEGGQTVVIEFDQRVDQNNTEVVFFENDHISNLPLWSSPAYIIRTHFSCITIKTPPCGRMSDNNVNAFFEVLSDNRRSMPHQFQYIPGRLGQIPQAAVYGQQEPRNRYRVRPMARFMEMREPTSDSDEEEPFDSTEEDSDSSDKSESEHPDTSGRDDSEDSSDSLYEAFAQLFNDDS